MKNVLFTFGLIVAIWLDLPMFREIVATQCLGDTLLNPDKCVASSSLVISLFIFVVFSSISLSIILQVRSSKWILLSIPGVTIVPWTAFIVL